jgi:hypothetical protein
MAETFEHRPAVWTAARLREALADLPADTPIHIGVADAPGELDEYGDYVLVAAEPVETDVADEATEVRFTLFADARAGVYYADLD